METNYCPTCHATIPTDAPGGFCPACLLREAEEPPAHGYNAPLLEKIAAAFPQLEVISLIGQGGMGYVYKVRQPSLDRVVALKILSPELGRDPAFAERFSREARTLGKLHHPNIVTVFEHGEAGGFFYLIMEYVDGVNLRQAMSAGRFTPQQALAIVPGVCDALQYAHEHGVWHRDIKPENILLDRDGKVKIADFGIARMIGDPQREFTLTMTGYALGSAAYMAPEQHEKPHEVDHRADIYSLGVVIYEMLTGELPLGRFPSPSQRAAVDARIDEIVFKTLEKERDLRQQSASEVKTDFSGTSNATGTAPKHSTPKGTTSREFPTFQWSVGLWIGGIAAMIAGFYTSPLLAGLGLIAVPLGLIGCVWILWKIRHGAHPKEHRLPLLLLAFWPVMIGLCFCFSAVWFRIWQQGLAQGDPDPSTAVYGFGAIAISVPLIIGRILWNLLGKDTEVSEPGRFEIIQALSAILLILSSSVLVKWVVEREVSYESYRSKFIQLGHDTNWPEDADLVRQAVVKSLGAHATHYRYQILGPEDLKLSTWLREGKSPFVMLETTIRNDRRAQDSQKHFNAIAERLKASLPKRIDVNSAAGGASGARDRNAPTELQRGYSNLRPWYFAFVMAPILVVMLSVATRRPLSWFLPFLALGIAVGVANSPWPKPLAALPPSIDGLAPLEPLPMPEYDFSTTRSAMGSLIKAAKNEDADAFIRGFSKEVTEGPFYKQSEIAERMREWEGITYGHQVSKDGDHAVVTLMNAKAEGKDREQWFMMKRENGEWKFTLTRDSHEVKPATSVPSTPAQQAPQQPVPPTVPVEEVLRKAVAAANESDGVEFRKHMWELKLLDPPNPTPGRTRQGRKIHSLNLVGMMELFVGDIVTLKVAAEINFPSVPEAYATIRRRDGSLSYLAVKFKNSGGRWIGTQAWYPLYRATSRIAFQPEKGDAASILYTHLGTASAFRAVEGKLGQYDVIAFSNDAESAKEIADVMVDQLRDSLKKFGLDTSLKVISPAAEPEAPYMAEDAPPFEAPKP